MIINSKDLLKQAQNHAFAFPHFNFWDSNSIRADIAAAEKLQLPVILAWAQKHSSEIGIEDALMLGKFYGSKAKVPVVLHLDHGTDPELVKWGAKNGFSSVMIDESDKDFDENVRITKDVTKLAHSLGLSVEAEIGHVGDNNSEDHSKYTEVDAAKRFAKLTSVDSLAVSIGTSHGVYKAGTPQINFDRLQDLKSNVKIPLVLHGGSSSGDANLTKAAEFGITKVNIYTDLANTSLKAATEKKFENETDMANYQRLQMQKLCEHYYSVFKTYKYQYQV